MQGDSPGARRSEQERRRALDEGRGRGRNRREGGREDGAAEGRRGRSGVPRHRPGRQGRPDRAPRPGERRPQGGERRFKSREPRRDVEQGEDPGDRPPEACGEVVLERTHRFLEDIEELL